MIDLFEEHGRSIVAVAEVPDDLVPSKGIVDARPAGDGVFEIAGLVEKPSVSEAPSNLGIVGRYVLTPEVVRRAGSGGARHGRRDMAHRRHIDAARYPGSLRLQVPGKPVRRGHSVGPSDGIRVRRASEGRPRPFSPVVAQDCPLTAHGCGEVVQGEDEHRRTGFD